ncbi:MAG: Ig-like domain-containing protein [Candidatus Marinimicrobia bacterium]|jgi:hypothetical protein|nr:Ig-like domain-containing protein [Candidatus Neomarinimicrobiota bacterium]MBT6471107.1 Ig-like domain-containing protein [Candidatus Neomarinimicrobiota bacterium]MBT6938642.1 Ig-like domain-containing protein [Candidatus Neomarinimicrobiota bacterium]MBT6940686.1 Ig-like domain-containing protein [Candidatus Neomarinimicrobiota bacterium]MBT7269574.1 Ig-like domain-containing protein [Candidatus Neomarinimicrobiota bacterium]
MKNFRLSTYFLFALLILCCEESIKPDTTPPTVSISSHSSGQTVGEIVTIVVTTQDNDGIDRVEYFINDSLELIDTESPFEYHWNTTMVEEGEYLVKAISYDKSENSTESQPIMLMVNNSSYLPSSVDVLSVNYNLELMTVIWEQSLSEDFSNYIILYADSENSDKSELDIYTNITDTIHTLTEFDPSQENWFWIKVVDTVGLYSIGDGMSNEIDSPPSIIEIYPITNTTDSFNISWSSSPDIDFFSYKLYESNNENMSNSSLVYTSVEQSDTSTVISSISDNEIRYYQIIVIDKWGLQTGSNIRVGSSYTMFMNIFGGNDFDNGNLVRQTNDGGYIIVGESRSTDFGETGVCLLKIDSIGEQEWFQTYGFEWGGNTNSGTGNSLSLNNDGGFIIVGKTATGTGLYGSSLILLKINSEGTEDWRKIIDPNDNGSSSSQGSVGYSIKNSDDGGYVIAGKYYHYNWGDKAWLLKVNINGNVEWENTFDVQGTDNWADNNILYDVVNAHDGGYIAVGQIDRDNEQEKVWLVKVDENGAEVWNKDLDEYHNNAGYSLSVTFDGGYVIGAVLGYQSGIIKVDDNGDETFSSQFNTGEQVEKVCSIEETFDNGFILFSENTHQRQLNLIKTNTSGQMVWLRQFGNDEVLTEIGGSASQTSDGGFIITGGTTRYNSEDYDILIIKTDPQGNTVPYGE